MPKGIKDVFGSMVFSDKVMQKVLPKETYEKVLEARNSGIPLNSEDAKIVVRNARRDMVDDLKNYANMYYNDEEYVGLRKKYDFATPFTKESLLYREIFEKYYPGQAEMVPDFWMPNKEWEGCNVNDPSARVLTNYGDSGK